MVVEQVEIEVEIEECKSLTSTETILGNVSHKNLKTLLYICTCKVSTNPARQFSRRFSVDSDFLTNFK